MIQAVHISSVDFSRCGDGELEAILQASRRNNLRDQITGLLLFNGRRFLQVLEGERCVVRDALLRNERDPRHRAIVVLSDRKMAER